MYRWNNIEIHNFENMSRSTYDAAIRYMVQVSTNVNNFYHAPIGIIRKMELNAE